ncbi:MAG: glycosyltransferase family 4 protein [Lachnospiraceae bacterium]|nr:glycosyltransferase family 4 protein [Lachnospiraceae bacterium]
MNNKTRDKKIKVLMVGPDRSVHGGISGVVNNLYDAGLDKRVDLTYIRTMKEGSKISKLFIAGIAYLKYCTRLMSCDLVHIHVASDSSFLRKSLFINKAYRSGKKIVIHQHGGEWEKYYDSLSANKQKKVREVFSKGNRFLVLSPYYKELFERIADIKGITVFPDTIKIDPPTEREYGLNKVLFLGRLCKAKGVSELIDAGAELKSVYPDLEITLAGIWEDNNLKEKALQHSDLIKLVGWVDKEAKQTLIREHDIFVLPSYFEGQSVAILEAMAGGMCVVASNVGGIPMMIKDNETGILVEPQNAKALKEGLIKALSDAELEEKLAKNARCLVEETFNISATVDDLEKIYWSLIDG